MLIDPPQRVEEIQELLPRLQKVLPVAGGTKPTLSTPPGGVHALDMSEYRGLVDYDPQELTFTARAGTPLWEIEGILAEHRQYLPFDPVFVSQGATLGGMTAAGLPGSGRYRFGGIRDFILGVSLLDGRNRVVRSGGKVVKNVAGFDLAKLMVGSRGCLGVLLELTFKVFPRPEAFATVQKAYENIDNALVELGRLRDSHLEIHHFDFSPIEDGVQMWIRIAGEASSLEAQARHLKGLIGECEVLTADDDRLLWQSVNEFRWVPPGWSLVKVPLTISRVPLFEAEIENIAEHRRYISGGQLAWLAIEEGVASLERVLVKQGLSGLVVRGASEKPRLGALPGHSFYRRVKAALDPFGRFVEA